MRTVFHSPSQCFSYTSYKSRSAPIETQLEPKINTFYSSWHRKRKTLVLLSRHSHRNALCLCFYLFYYYYYSYDCLMSAVSSCLFFGISYYRLLSSSVLGCSHLYTSSCSQRRAPHLVVYHVGRITRCEVAADPSFPPKRCTLVG